MVKKFMFILSLARFKVQQLDTKVSLPENHKYLFHTVLILKPEC